VPGKEEFHETLRYFRGRLEETGVEVRLGTRATVDDLTGFDAVILASGVVPRVPSLGGLDHPKVVSYVDVLSGRVEVGRRAALVGGGGIAVDTATFLAEPRPGPTVDLDAFLARWGIDREQHERGGLTRPGHVAPLRELWILQRSEGRIGSRLGKTTGWAHRRGLDHLGVRQLSGVRYRKVDDLGLHVEIDQSLRVLDVDHVVICAGQEPERRLLAPLRERGVEVHVVGGAKEAGELDAERAIREGTEVAVAL
jgi:2,4-dienoyl-CoA reductase (NADPH2)